MPVLKAGSAHGVDVVAEEAAVVRAPPAALATRNGLLDAGLAVGELRAVLVVASAVGAGAPGAVQVPPRGAAPDRGAGREVVGHAAATSGRAPAARGPHHAGVAVGERRAELRFFAAINVRRGAVHQRTARVDGRVDGRVNGRVNGRRARVARGNRRAAAPEPRGPRDRDDTAFELHRGFSLLDDARRTHLRGPRAQHETRGPSMTRARGARGACAEVHDPSRVVSSTARGGPQGREKPSFSRRHGACDGGARRPKGRSASPQEFSP